MNRFCRHIVMALGASILVGCASKRTDRFDPDTLNPRRRIAAEPISPIDQPGPIMYNDVSLNLLDRPQDREARGESVTGISQTVEQSVTLPGQRRQAAPPGTSPTTMASASSGGYFTIGGVVADVNGTAIYAHKILDDLEPLLSARAKDLNEREFQQLAANEIRKQIVDEINHELEFAAAQRHLDNREKELANFRTEEWRQRQITDAQGSLEQARRLAAEKGEDFEALVKQQYRIIMSRLFYQKKVFPHIQVTAQDLRDYYDEHHTTEFTVPERVKFRAIKVEKKKLGSAAAAREKIEDLRRRAAQGANFAELAQYSTDPAFVAAGEIPLLRRGAFAVEKLEEAAWKLQPGEITEIVETDDAFYIAKLEQRQAGRTVPFEELSTQEAIRTKLQAEQFQALREQVQQALREDAIVRGDPIQEPRMMRPALEIAMQRYAAWRRQ